MTAAAPADAVFMIFRWRLAALLPAALLGQAAAAAAATYVVGPDQSIKAPSAAIAMAHDGDTIRIEPLKGGYFDCAIVKQSHLTIEGTADGVVLTDLTCGGKAILVVDGTDVTIRHLTLARARVPDRNGAGIRAEGTDLQVDNVRFVDNEVAILAADSPRSRITITDSQFIDNGDCTDTRCNSAISVASIALLHIEHSTFRDTHGGDDILSYAVRTELAGDDIADGPTGTARYLVHMPDGGSLEMRDNLLEKGPHTADVPAAVSVEAPFGSRPIAALIVAGNRFTNDSGRSLSLLHNLSTAPADMTNNTIGRDSDLVSTNGFILLWMKSFAHAMLDRAHATAYALARGLRDDLRKL